jgi:Family of unknown function (DUF6494)
MDDDAFNMSIRKFLKMVGVNSQREIERAVAQAEAAHRVAGGQHLPATMTLEIPGVGLRVVFDGEIHVG